MARVPNQHIALVLDAGAECQATRPAGDDPVVGGGASTCFDVVRALATQYMLHQVSQAAEAGARRARRACRGQWPPRGRPAATAARVAQSFVLARAAEQGLELLSGVRSNASNATKLVLIACSAAGCGPAAGLDAAAASGADSTAVEVM